MKKSALLISLVAVLALGACDTKDCRCYSYQGNRWTGPHTYTTSLGTPCSSLNNPTTYCNEMDDPIINPDDIAIGKKKK